MEVDTKQILMSSILGEDILSLLALGNNQKAALFDKLLKQFTLLKGDPGEPGPDPSDSRIIELIKPLIPPPIPGEKGDSIQGKPGTTGAKGLPGYTPQKGVDYFTEEEITTVAEMAAGFVETAEAEKIEIDNTFVKRIIQAMKKLPMNDRLEVQDIRNWQSMRGKESSGTFKKDGVTYKVEELMHGAGTGGGGATSNIITEYSLTAVQAGADVTVALSQLSHFATLVGVIVAYRNQIPQTQGVTCNITGTSVTFFNADASEIFSITYTYA